MISSEREEGRVQRIKEMISFHGTLGFSIDLLRGQI